MSVREGVGAAATTERKPIAVLIFLPVLILLLAGAAILLGQMSGTDALGASGYGIDERITGAIVPIETDGPAVLLDP